MQTKIANVDRMEIKTNDEVGVGDGPKTSHKSRQQAKMEACAKLPPSFDFQKAVFMTVFDFSVREAGVIGYRGGVGLEEVDIGKVAGL
jgi:hypothetical protein